MIREFLTLAHRYWVVAVATLIVSAPAVLAGNSVTNRPTNRWLFIVETSSSMKERADAVQKVAASLLWNGMNGQVQSGDTIGLWSYNKEFYAGEFPLQEWSPGRREMITANLFEFLKALQYQKSGHLSAFLPSMESLVKESEYITIVLINDGREKMRNTPFDDQINSTYASWTKKQTKAHIPFVTILRAQHGKMTSFTVAMPPFNLEMPPLPPELIPPAPKVVQKPPAPVPVVPPLIVTGKKPLAQETNPSLSNPGSVAAANANVSATPEPGQAQPAPAAMVVATATTPVPVDNKTASTALPVTAPVAAQSVEPAARPEPKPAPARTVSVTPNATGDVLHKTAATPNAPAQTAVERGQQVGSSTERTILTALAITGVLFLAGLLVALYFDRTRRSRTPLRVSLVNRPLN